MVVSLHILHIILQFLYLYLFMIFQFLYPHIPHIFLPIQPVQHSHSSHSDLPSSLTSISSSPAIPPSPPRRSTRLKTQPRYLQQCHCQLAASSLPSLSSFTAPNSGIPYSLSSYLFCDKLSPTYRHFCFSIFAQPEPKF